MKAPCQVSSPFRAEIRSHSIVALQRVACLGWIVLIAIGCGSDVTPEPAEKDSAEVADSAQQTDAIDGDTAHQADVEAGETSGTIDDAVSSGCDADDDCEAAGQVCHLATATCVECNVALDCAGGSNVAGWMCKDNACSERTPCESDKACVAADMVCEKVVGYCVECVSDDECASGLTCKGNVCMPPPAACSSSKDCSSLDYVCDKKLGLCVQCITDSDCLSGEYCVATLCAASVCQAGARQCKSSAVAQLCSAGGKGWVDEPCTGGAGCVDGTCKSQVCTPGLAYCESEKAMLCAPDGTATTEVADCTKPGAGGKGQTCVAGSCLASGCAPGETVCAGEKLLVKCGSDGKSWQNGSCEAEAPFCVAGKCVVCKPGTKFCPPGGEGKATFALVCSPSGSDGEIAETCSGGNVCVAGACGPKPAACTPGQAKCEGNTASVCTADGSTWLTTTCATTKACVKSACDAELGGCAFVPVSCDDGNPCTEDSCSEPAGCSHKAGGSWCDDGDACTKLGSCVDGGCVSGGAVDCDDGEGCTKDVCDKAAGCVHQQSPDGTGCSDGDACTSGDACVGAKCTPGKVDGWQLLVGGTNPEYGHVVLPAEGGFVFGGNTNSIDLPLGGKTSGGQDAWFGKVSGSGALMWSTAWGGSASETIIAGTARKGGGTAFVGTTNSQDLPFVGALKGNGDGLIVLVDAEGKVIGAKAYGGNGAETFFSVLALPDDGLLIGGATTSTSDLPGGANKLGSNDMWLLRTNELGTLVWARTFGVPGGHAEIKGIALRQQGGYALAGWANWKPMPLQPKDGPGTAYYDAVLILTDENGQAVSYHNYGGSYTDNFSAISALPSGGFVLGGYSDSTSVNGLTSNGGRDVLLLGVDANGKVQWTKLLGGIASDELRAVRALADGTVAFIAETKSLALPGGANGYGNNPDFWLAKTNTTGDVAWSKIFGGTGYDGPRDLALLPDGGYLLVGESGSIDNPSGVKPKGSYDTLLIRTNAAGDATCAIGK